MASWACSPWWTGMIGIARAPDDQDGHALGEVEPVAGVDALAAVPTTERSVARKAARRSGSASEA